MPKVYQGFRNSGKGCVCVWGGGGGGGGVGKGGIGNFTGRNFFTG